MKENTLKDLFITDLKNFCRSFGLKQPRFIKKEMVVSYQNGSSLEAKTYKDCTRVDLFVIHKDNSKSIFEFKSKAGTAPLCSALGQLQVYSSILKNKAIRKFIVTDYKNTNIAIHLAESGSDIRYVFYDGKSGGEFYASRVPYE